MLILFRACFPFQRVFRISNKKKKRLEESRDFHTFSQSVKEENVFIEEKAQLAASKEVGKNLISLTRLQKKLQVIFITLVFEGLVFNCYP